MQNFKKSRGFLVFLLFSGAFLFAQNQESLSLSGEHFFVSELKGELRNNLIRLSWKDSLQIRGPVFIYRSRRPFEESLDTSILDLPVEIPYGVQSYIDEIEEAGSYYYFAATSDERGQRYIFLALDNNVISVFAEANSSLPAQLSRANPLQPQQTGSANVRAIRAEINGNAVIISFVRGQTDSKTILYRSISPIVRAVDLFNAIIIQSNVSSPYTDYPAPGIPYHYALVNEEDLIRGSVNIIAGVNATVSAVEIPRGEEDFFSSPVLRTIPLPEVTLKAAGIESNGINESISSLELGVEAEKVISNISFPQKIPHEKIMPEAEILPPDENTSGDGELFLLDNIVNGSFSNRDWNRCLDEINRFLSRPRSPALDSKARFYSGQSFFFLGLYREALFEFIKAQVFFPSRSSVWIQHSLDFLNE